MKIEKVGDGYNILDTKKKCEGCGETVPESVTEKHHFDTNETEELCGNCHKEKTWEQIIRMGHKPKGKSRLKWFAGCEVCGYKGPGVDEHHIIPKKKGGEDIPENLIYLCKNHHNFVTRSKAFKKKVKDFVEGQTEPRKESLQYQNWEDFQQLPLSYTLDLLNKYMYIKLIRDVWFRVMR